jgi:uncharacterized coiled-coil DUF342 family protein
MHECKEKVDKLKKLKDVPDDLKKLEEKNAKHSEKFKELKKHIDDLMENLQKGDEDDKKSSSSSDAPVEKDDFEKLEEKFKHHVEHTEKLEESL